MTFIKLPNGNIARVSDDDRIRVVVEVAIFDIVNCNLDEFLDILSMRATGSDLLSDISYDVVGHSGNTIQIAVFGDIGSIDDAEEVDFDALPLQTFDVEVTRIGYGTRNVMVKARTIEEAENLADEDAGNHLYDEHASEYGISATLVVNSDLDKPVLA